MFSRTAMCAKHLRARGICTTDIKMQKPLMQPSLVKLRKLQAKFQQDDGKHVWQKGGFSDRVIYTSNFVGLIIAVTMSFQFFYEVAKPPSWKTE